MRFWRGIILILLLSFFLNSLAFSNSPASKKLQHLPRKIASVHYWPQEDWRKASPESQGVDSEHLWRMFSFIKEGNIPIQSVIIIRNGYLITEAYLYPFQKNFQHILYSCTKSITSALTGIAVKEGYIKNVNEQVLLYFSDLKVNQDDPRKTALTVKHLLTMSTGLKWNENGMYGTDTDSWTQMWKTSHQIQYILDQPMRSEPGKEFYYCSGASHLLSGILQRTTGQSSFEYGRKKLFEPLGIKDVYWSTDLNGVNIGGSHIFLKPADMARFGYLYLKKGKWNDRQIIPEQWVAESTQKQINTPQRTAYGYGYQWWMNSFGGYSARGYGGQYIFVLPQDEMVIVFTSGLPRYRSELPESLVETFILPAIRRVTPAKPNPNGNRKLAQIIKEVSQSPEPKPIPKLPDTAARISGKKIDFGGPLSYSLIFNDKNEGWLTISDQENQYRIPMSLDDVYRPTDIGNIGPLPDHNHGAYKGWWSDENTFVIDAFSSLEDGDQVQYFCTFESDKVNVRVYSKMYSFVEGIAIQEWVGTIEE